VLLYRDTRAIYAQAKGSTRTTFKPGLATRTASELLTSAAVALGDVGLSFDRMHLTKAGNERIADALVGPVIQMAEQAGKDAAVSATR
jgi:hypothetical protein